MYCNFFRFIHRKRHSAGFGVHSPFAFDLILNTIHSPHQYYCYDRNRYLIKKTGLYNKKHIKYAELLFRLVNRFNSKNILQIGCDNGVDSLYISSFSAHVNVLCIEHDIKKTEIAKTLLSFHKQNIIFTNMLPTTIENKFNAIIWDLDFSEKINNSILKQLNSLISDKGFIVANNIHRTKQNRELWEKILENNNSTMSFNLRTIGVVFFNDSLPKLNYDISF